MHKGVKSMMEDIESWARAWMRKNPKVEIACGSQGLTNYETYVEDEEDRLLPILVEAYQAGMLGLLEQAEKETEAENERIVGRIAPVDMYIVPTISIKRLRELCGVKK